MRDLKIHAIFFEIFGIYFGTVPNDFAKDEFSICIK